MRAHSYQSAGRKTESVTATPSIPRRSSQQVFPHNKVGLAQMVVKIEWGVAHLEKVKGNAVKTPSAELNLAEYFDSACVWLDQLLQKKDKRQLRSVFEGSNMKVLAHLESLCERVELKVSSDKRRLDLMERCRTVEEVLADMGYAAELRQAKIAEEQGFLEDGEEEEQSTAEEVVPHLTDAAFLGAQAIAQEHVGDFQGAVEAYDKATKSLRAAIAVGRAVVKFKASVGGESGIENDVAQLQRLEDQTNHRIEHLQSLDPGSQPVPIEEHIQPVELSMHMNVRTQQKMTRAYIGYGVSAGAAVGGLFLAGPFGLVLLAGAAVGGVIAARQNRHEDFPELLETLADMGDVAVDTAEIAKPWLSDMAETAKPWISEAHKSIELAKPWLSEAHKSIEQALAQHRQKAAQAPPAA